MTHLPRRRRRPIAIGAWLLAALGLVLTVLHRDVLAESVMVFGPVAISFAVTNVSVSTAGNPSPTPMSFSNAVLTSPHVVRLSVKADSDFVPPSGAAIPASKVSWTTSTAVNGTGSAGTLSKTVYVQIFQSAATKTSGSVNVTWTLAAPGTPLRAGAHGLTMRWKLEAI